MRKTTLLDRVVKFITGKTPGLSKENEAVCKRSSDQIDISSKERYKASVNFSKAQEELTETIDHNVALNESVFIKATKA